MKTMFISPLVADAILFDRNASKSRLLQLELPGETSQMIPEVSLVLSSRAETARGVVELGSQDALFSSGSLEDLRDERRRLEATSQSLRSGGSLL